MFCNSQFLSIRAVFQYQFIMLTILIKIMQNEYLRACINIETGLFSPKFTKGGEEKRFDSL